jgi:hypothetical protein
MNNMGREIMAALKRFQTGSDGDGVTVGGSLVVSGSTTANTFSATQITASGTIITAAGTNSAPAIVPTGDTNTGIFFPAADTIAFAEGGAEAMRLDSSGTLGLGVTPSAWFSTWKAIQVGASASLASRTDVFGTLLSQNAIINAAGDNAYIGSAAASRYSLVGGEHQWFTAPSGTAGNNITFAERMRITSGGDFLVGTTSNPGDYKIRASSSASGAAISTSSTTATVLDLQPNSDGTGQVAVVVYSQSAAAERLKIFSNGNVQNTNNSYGALSDIKIKENIVDATPKLEKLNQVRVVNFNIIGSEQKQIGVVAQELEQIFPSMVDESPDRDAEGNNLGTTTKSVKYSVFVPMLIKAIQELKAELDTVKAELATLKGN